MAVKSVEKTSERLKEGVEKGRNMADQLRREGIDHAERLRRNGVETIRDHLPHQKRRRHRWLVIVPTVLFGIGLAIVLLRRRKSSSVNDNGRRRVEDWHDHQNAGTSTSTLAHSPPLTQSGRVEPNTLRPYNSAGMELTSVAMDFGSLIGREVKDSDGKGLGEVQAIYVHKGATEPEWIALSLGLADKREMLAPLEGAKVEEEIALAYPKDEVEQAPELIEGKFTLDDEMKLYTHYHVQRMPPPTPTGAEAEDLLRRWPDQAA